MRHPSKHHSIPFLHSLNEHRRAGRNGRGGGYGLGVDVQTVVVKHVVFPVESGIAIERVAHQVPAFPLVVLVVGQRNFAYVADVGRAAEGKGDIIRIGIKVALASFELEGVAGFVVLPFVAFVRRFETVEVVMRCGVGNEVVDCGRTNGALQWRGDELPAAVARAVAGDVLGDRRGHDVWPQGLAR